MGMIKSALKAGVVVKIVDVVRREAAKPENQQKAREMVSKISSRTGKSRQMP